MRDKPGSHMQSPVSMTGSPGPLLAWSAADREGSTDPLSSFPKRHTASALLDAWIYFIIILQLQQYFAANKTFLGHSERRPQKLQAKGRPLWKNRKPAPLHTNRTSPEVLTSAPKFPRDGVIRGPRSWNTSLLGLHLYCSNSFFIAALQETLS